MKFFTKCLAIFKAWGEDYTILTFQNCLQKQLEENSDLECISIIFSANLSSEWQPVKRH